MWIDPLADRFQPRLTFDRAALMGTHQHVRPVDGWLTGILLQAGNCGTHSLRRIKASIIDKQTSTLCAVQILLGHTKIESPVQYLGMDGENALTFSKRNVI